jgi:hypothetical protein
MTWMVVLAIAVGALALIALLNEWWMGRISLRWPVAEAKLDFGEVARARRRYVVRLRYSYFVAGSLYGGTWFKHFATEAEATRLLKSLRELLVLVRYDPHQPARSYFDTFRDIRMEK